MRRQARHRRIDMQMNHALKIAGFKRPVAGQHLIQQDADAVDIGAGFSALSERLLRRHVNRGAKHYAAIGRVSERGIEIFRNAKVGQCQGAVGAHHDVVRFQVAVDNAGAVGRFQPGSDLADDPQDGIFSQRFAHQAGQAAAREILHRDEGAFIVEALCINRHNIRMLDAFEHLVLGNEAVEHVGRRIGFEADRFQGDRLTALFCVRQIHRCHAAGGEPRIDHVAAEFLAGIQG